MPRQQDKEYKEPDLEDVVELLPDDETFCIGQSYEDEAATTFSCAECKSKVFNVGQGCYFTAIRCVNCGWQTGIHEG